LPYGCECRAQLLAVIDGSLACSSQNTPTLGQNSRAALQPTFHTEGLDMSLFDVIL